MDTDQRTIEIVLKAQDANASIKEMATGAAVMTAQLSRMGQDDPGRAQLLADLQTMNQRLTASRAEMRQVTQSAEQLAAAETEAAAAAEHLARANEETVSTGQQATASLNQMRAAANLMERALADMSQDDPRRAALQQDFATLTQRIGTTTTALRTQARSAEELAAAQEALVAENMRVVVEGQQVNATFNQMRASASQLEAQLGELSQDDPGRAQLLADYRALQQRIAAVREEMGEAAPQVSLFKQALGMAGIVVSVEAVVGSVVEMGKAIFDTTSKFETYSAVMKNALGSESAAQLALHDIQTMAAKTPFSVDELTSSFIKFVNRGLKPSMEDMKKMADIAASQGKSFDQLTEAVLDAGTGEFERLKEFGIQASKSGDQVSLSFKGVQKTVANTPEAIQAALLGFGELNGVMGSTDAISKTLAGTTSNLGDTADSAALAWGGILLPAFKAVLSTIGFLIGALGAIPAFLVENRGLLLGLAAAVATLNFSSMAATASTLGHLAAEKARAVATRASAAAQWLLNAAMTANPIGLVVAAVLLLVGAFVTLYERSEKFRGAVAGMGAALKAFVTTYIQGVMQALTGLSDMLAGVFTRDPERIKKGLLEMGTSVKTIYYDAGKNAGAAFNKGYDEGVAKGHDFTQVLKDAMSAEAKRLDAVAKARQAAEATARMEALKSQEADLKVRLAGVEEGTRQELKLKQQLIGVQAKIELEDAKKSEDDKRVIRAEAQGKIQDLETAFNAKQAAEREKRRKELEKLAAEEAKKELEMLHTMQDARVAAMANERLRELAENDLHINRKIEALKGSEEQITEQKMYLEAERRQKEVEIRAKWDEEDAKKKEADAEKQAELNAAADEEYAAYLENKVANGLKSEQDYQEALYNLKKQALEDQLALAIKLHGAESAEAKKTRAEQLKLDTNHVKQQKEMEKDFVQFKKQMNASYAGLLADALSMVVDNLDKQSSAYVLFKAAMKTAQLAEIGMNVIAETSNNALMGSRDVRNLIPGGSAIVAAEVALKNGLAIGRAALAAVKIAAFAKGGPTDQLTNQLPLASLASLLSGQSGGSSAPDGSFAGGGPVDKATIGLIGEAGPELVIPNWLYADPKQANLMGFLEAQIASRGNAFATGGSTTGASAVASPVSDDPSGQLLDVLERIARGQQEFRDEIGDWQRNLVVQNNLQDVAKGLKTVQDVKGGGGIR